MVPTVEPPAFLVFIILPELIITTSAANRTFSMAQMASVLVGVVAAMGIEVEYGGIGEGSDPSGEEQREFEEVFGGSNSDSIQGLRQQATTDNKLLHSERETDISLVAIDCSCAERYSLLFC